MRASQYQSRARARVPGVIEHRVEKDSHAPFIHMEHARELESHARIVLLRRELAGPSVEWPGKRSVIRVIKSPDCGG